MNKKKILVVLAVLVLIIGIIVAVLLLVGKDKNKGDDTPEITTTTTTTSLATTTTVPDETKQTTVTTTAPTETTTETPTTVVITTTPTETTTTEITTTEKETTTTAEKSTTTVTTTKKNTTTTTTKKKTTTTTTKKKPTNITYNYGYSTLESPDDFTDWCVFNPYAVWSENDSSFCGGDWSFGASYIYESVENVNIAMDCAWDLIVENAPNRWGKYDKEKVQMPTIYVYLGGTPVEIDDYHEYNCDYSDWEGEYPYGTYALEKPKDTRGWAEFYKVYEWKANDGEGYWEFSFDVCNYWNYSDVLHIVNDLVSPPDYEGTYVGEEAISKTVWVYCIG